MRTLHRTAEQVNLGHDTRMEYPGIRDNFGTLFKDILISNANSITYLSLQGAEEF